MSLGDALKNLNEFFLEFLGFFLPGFTFIFLFGLFIESKVLSSILTFIKATEINTSFLFVFLSYIIGYVIYGINLSTNKICNHRATIEEKIQESEEYKISKKVIDSKFTTENMDLKVNGYRSIAMSVIGKENVQTIYTFMFRADLCSHLKIVCIIVGIFGILSFSNGLSGFGTPFVNNPIQHYAFCITLFVIAFFLTKTSRRFLSIALRIGFSMFLSKIYFDK